MKPKCKVIAVEITVAGGNCKYNFSLTGVLGLATLPNTMKGKPAHVELPL